MPKTKVRKNGAWVDLGISAAEVEAQVDAALGGVSATLDMDVVLGGVAVGSPTYISRSDGFGHNVITFAVTKPTGVQTGDLLIMFVQDFDAGDLTQAEMDAALAGWTVLGNSTGGSSKTLFCAYKIATGSEPASYTFRGTTNTATYLAYSMLCYRNAGVPILKGTTGTVNVDTLSPAAAGVTTGQVVLAAASVGGGAYTVDSPFSLITSVIHGNGQNLQVASVTAPSDGTYTPSFNGPESGQAMTVVLPAPMPGSHILAATDAGKVVEMAGTGAITLTIPPESVEIPVGSMIFVRKTGASGTLTIVEGTNVVMNPDPVVLDEQWQTALLHKRSALQWHVQKIANVTKGVANGVASLDGSALVPLAQIPTITAAKVAADVATQAELDAVSTVANAAIPATQKAAVNGVASLGADGKVPSAQLPAATAPTLVHAFQATDYTLVLADAGKIIDFTSAGDLTIPPNSSVAFPIGTIIYVRQAGITSPSIKAGAGVTIRQRENKTRLMGQWAEASIIKRATDEWVLVGDLRPGALSFNYTGAVQEYTIPAGVTSLVVEAAGASGGPHPGTSSGAGGNLGGAGGAVLATLAVTPGETLSLYVGGTGGYNGGGTGGGWPGGGATDIRRGGIALADRILVAGGGGGAPQEGYSGTGGLGGGTTGAQGHSQGTSQVSNFGRGGHGGTPTAGGAGGIRSSGSVSYGSAGVLGVGGAGQGGTYAGGAGGGGYYGGGGGGMGGWGGGGGGGGSSYVEPAATSVSHQQGVRSGHGYIKLDPIGA